MASPNVIQTNFTTGEISPLMYGRIDYTKYFNGVKRLKNFFVHPQGPIERRQGTQYITPVKDSTKKTRLIPFIFSMTQAYMLEFGHNYIRFFKDNAPIIDTSELITNGTFDSNITTGWTSDLGDGASAAWDATNKALELTVDRDQFLLNPTFATSLTNWTDADTGTGVSSWSSSFGGSMEMNAPVSSSAMRYQAVTTQIGQSYTISVQDSGFLNNNPPRCRVGTTAGGTEIADVLIQNATTTTFNFTATATTTYIAIHVLGDLFVSRSFIMNIEMYQVSTIAQHRQTAITTISGDNYDWSVNLTNVTGVPVCDIVFGTTAGASDLGQVRLFNGSNSGTVNSTGTTTVHVTLQALYAVSSPDPLTPQKARFDDVSFKHEDVPVETTTTYTEDELDKIRWVQSADVLYLVHPNHPPAKLTRTSDISWPLTDADITDGPYLPINITATTITPSAVTGSITLTASTGIFAATDVGRWVRTRHGTSTITWGAMQITAYTSPTQVTATVYEPFPPTAAATEIWRLGAWSDTTGWPSEIELHQQRLFFANTPNNPDTFWGSITAAYELLSPTEPDGSVNDDNGLTFTLAADQINQITMLAELKALMIGTFAGPFSVAPSNLGSALTPTDAKSEKESHEGAKQTRPAKIGKSLVYVSRSGKRLKELIYDFRQDGYAVKDISMLSQHLLNSKVVEIVTVIEPDTYLYAILDSGALIGMAYLPNEEVIAFYEHPIGGNGLVKSIGVIPSSNAEYDELWLIVERTIDGSTVQYIEFLREQFTGVETQMFYVDSGLYYSGTGTTTLSGLDHLEGETVQIFTNKGVHPPQVVESGGITLDYSVTYAAVGLQYISILETLPPELTSDKGNTTGRVKRIDHLYLQLLNTGSFKHGPSDSELYQYEFRETEGPLDDNVPLYSGLIDVPFDGYSAQRPTVVIQQDLPLPMSVVQLTMELQAYD